MASRLYVGLLFLGSVALSACSAPLRSVDEPAPSKQTTTDAPGPAADALPAMCRMVRPADVLLEWAELPEVRLGRIPSNLSATVTPEEHAADPDFDGFRLGTVDYQWTYREPVRTIEEERPVRLDIANTASGFTATFLPGRNGRLLDDTGPKNEYEFLPDARAPIVYAFERVKDCWVLVSVIESTETPQP